MFSSSTNRANEAMVRSTQPTGPFDENAMTRALRPPHGFDKDTLNQIRTLRKQGVPGEEIAEMIGGDLERVRVALAALRTRRMNPNRRTINVGREAFRELQEEQRPGEPMWQTIDRLLTELHELRGR